MKFINDTAMNEFFQELEEKAKGNRSFWNSSALSFANTLETTLKVMEDGTVYVITGDIPAMWLRDSTAQIRPYLFLGKRMKR